VPIDHSIDTNIAPEVPIGNDHSKTGRPRRNVGNYKQGPAKIRRLPIVGEEYDFSFLVISEWDQQVPIIANRGNVQMKYHPQQRIQKSFLAECYLLQDCWTSDPNCIHQIYSNVILNSWESDDIYLRRIQLVKIATNNQLGDLFTKGLDKISFAHLQKMLMGW
jgi:hypothetical protein